jgi:hypothetical protein
MHSSSFCAGRLVVHLADRGIANMTGLSSLPAAAVKHILQLARTRCIPGTNKYARVCRQWQEASSSSFDNTESLQLYVNPGHMSAEELDSAIDWMAMHGLAVTTLVMDASFRETQQLQSLWPAVPAMPCLTKLEVRLRDSLSLLAPALGQLPQLRHLAAHVTLVEGEDMPMLDDWEVSLGLFWHKTPDGPGMLWDVPDLQHVCPQLTHLHLLCENNGALVVGEPLPRLLPAGLQQLKLGRDSLEPMWLQSSSLVHLSALQQLTLEDVRVVGEGLGSVAQDLGALRQLQQVRIHHIDGWVLETHDMLQLAPMIAACWWFAPGQELLVALPHLVHLTELVLSARTFIREKEVPEGTAGALAAMTGLQELTLDCLMDASLVPVLQQVAALPTLRSLDLEGVVGVPGLGLLAHGLALCTQLTSLLIRDVSKLAMGSCVAAVQQLTALKSVTMPAELLQWEGGACLARLTALTELGVNLGGVDDEGTGTCDVRSKVQGLLEKVQAWPAGLQQVLVVWCTFRGCAHPKRECWKFTQAAPGGGKFSVWVEEFHTTITAPGWARPFSPCPHLPGVWELQAP